MYIIVRRRVTQTLSHDVMTILPNVMMRRLLESVTRSENAGPIKRQ